jgi:predicted glutamine amidotransferase
MCRFLMVKSRAPFDSRPWLEKFADMAEASRAPDGDRQADGWGVSWVNGDGGWHELKSVAPVWEERDAFASVPSCRILAIHARSASFPNHKGVLDYSQPFVEGRHAFVFNGLLKGVSLPARNDAGIGSQRIWGLFRSLIGRDGGDSDGRGPAAISLERLIGILERRSREVAALNIGLCDGSRIFAYCRFADYPSYYHLHALESPGLAAVCSCPLPGLDFRPVPTGRILSF